jgi:hypothetical protein
VAVSRLCLLCAATRCVSTCSYLVGKSAVQHATGDVRCVSLNDMRIAYTHTSVADMPGYPTRKLLLGGPETRTKAAMVAYGMELVGAGLGWQQALHGRRLGMPKLPLSSAVSLADACVV